MSTTDNAIALETTEKNGNQYRITYTNKFGGLFSNYISNEHGVVPTRLVEYFKDCKSIATQFPNNMAVITYSGSWDSLIADAKNYAKNEIEAIKERQDRGEIDSIIPILEEIINDNKKCVLADNKVVGKAIKDFDNKHSDLMKALANDTIFIPQETKKPYCIELHKAFDSFKKAAKTVGARCDHISECCRGKRKSAGKMDGKKLHWIYC